MPTFGRYGRFPLKLGGGRRPWTVAGESDRIRLSAPAQWDAAA